MHVTLRGSGSLRNTGERHGDLHDDAAGCCADRLFDAVSRNDERDATTLDCDEL